MLPCSSPHDGTLTLATSVDVKRIFSRGHTLLTHTCNGLEAQTVRSLLCLGEWLKAGIISVKNIASAISGLLDLEGDEEVEMEEGWDSIRK